MSNTLDTTQQGFVRCDGEHSRHTFKLAALPGSRTPFCQRCDAPNPRFTGRYDLDRYKDLRASWLEQWSGDDEILQDLDWTRLCEWCGAAPGDWTSSARVRQPNGQWPRRTLSLCLACADEVPIPGISDAILRQEDSGRLWLEPYGETR